MKTITNKTSMGQPTVKAVAKKYFSWNGKTWLLANTETKEDLIKQCEEDLKSLKKTPEDDLESKMFPPYPESFGGTGDGGFKISTIIKSIEKDINNHKKQIESEKDLGDWIYTWMTDDEYKATKENK